MKVLVACESSGAVRRAFMQLGHAAYSCDILPADDGNLFHYQGDALEVIRSSSWDLVIAHPPCTHISSSGARHWKAKQADGRQQAGIDFFFAIASACNLHADRWAIENPVGIMSRLWRKPDQIIQPYQFGHDASKTTCLWLKNLPPLRPTKLIAPRMVAGVPRWSNQTDSGQNRLSPSDDRWKKRSATYQRIAVAMATQWSTPCPNV